jgi:hypothetical protein
LKHEALSFLKKFQAKRDFLPTTFFDRLQNFGDCFAARFGPEIAFAVDPDAHYARIHVALSDHEHGVDFHLLSALDFAVDLIGALVEFRANLMSTQFV